MRDTGDASTSTSTFNGVAVAVAAPGRSARAVQGRHPGRARGPLGSRRRLRQRPHPREARREYKAANPDRVAPPSSRDRAVNAALGTAGVVLGLACCRCSASSRSCVGLVRQAAGAAADGRALYVGLRARSARWSRSSPWSGRCITRDFSLQFVADNGSTPHAAALQRRHAVVGARGLDPAVGADPRRLHVAVVVRKFRDAARPTRSSAGRCSTMFVVAAFFFGLMLGPANPFQQRRRRRPARRPRARTRCCRTTR